MFDDPGEPRISQRTYRRIFGRGLVVGKHGTGTPVVKTRSGPITLHTFSNLEYDDTDEQYDYRSIALRAEYDPQQPYSRFRAGRLAMLLQEAMHEAREQQRISMENSGNDYNLMDVLFGENRLVPVSPKGRLPGLYPRDPERHYPLPRTR